MQRRTYLKAAAATALGAGLAASGSASAGRTVTEKDGYEVWEISGTEVYELSDGETLENVLIDQRADGANLYITAPYNPTGWTIRNVGWLGLGTVSDTDGWGGAFHMTVSGDGLIENVFIDNRDLDRDTEIGGALLPNHHSGTIEVRNTFIAGMGNNAFYGSNPGKNDGNEGTVEFYNCYHRDNTVSQFRMGTPGSLVENCVGVVNDPDGARGTYPNTTSRRARGTWTRNMPDNTIRNSVMYVDPDDDDPWANYMVDNIWKSNSEETVKILDGGMGNADAPLLTRVVENDYEARIEGTVETDGLTVDVIQDGGVPMSPTMAAKGNREMPPELPGSDGSTGDTTLDHTLTIDGRNTGRTDYVFTVSGDIENNPDVGTFDPQDDITGSTATGFVHDGVDGYQFAGEIAEAAVDGDAAIIVDGQEVDPATLGDDGPAVTTDPATDVTDTGATLNGSLDDLGGAASADVSFEHRETGTDAWTTTAAGSLDAPGSFSATVDGLDVDTEYEYRAVADASDGDSSTGSLATVTTSDLPRTLTIDGSDAGWTDYQFSVTGDIAENADAGSLGTGDEIDGSTASGFVNGGTDGYRFSGDLVGFDIDGDAAVVVDGQAVDPGTLGLPNEIVIDGRNSSETSTYTFEVSGDLKNDPLLGATDSADTVDGSSASGDVTGNRDGFRFSGDLRRFSVDGDADVRFEDNDG